MSVFLLFSVLVEKGRNLWYNRIEQLRIEGRKVRRKDREITGLNEITKILDRAEVLRIALHDGDFPYILPVNFGYERNGQELVLYFHGAKEGKKHELIRKDNRAAFEADCGHMLLRPVGEEPCTASYAYESVTGQGVIEKAEEEEKARLLAGLLRHYGIAAETLRSDSLTNTVVYKIRVLGCTAKRRTKDR